MKIKKYKLNLMPQKVRIMEMGMIPKAFARKVHIDPTTIYAYFSGKSTPTVRMLLKLCNATGIEPGALFKEDVRKKK